jgi:hypothetical protein
MKVFKRIKSVRKKLLQRLLGKQLWIRWEKLRTNIDAQQKHCYRITIMLKKWLVLTLVLSLKMGFLGAYSSPLKKPACCHSVCETKAKVSCCKTDSSKTSSAPIPLTPQKLQPPAFDLVFYDMGSLILRTSHLTERFPFQNHWPHAPPAPFFLTKSAFLI